MSKIYLAGGLFNEAQIAQRVKEGNLLESLTDCTVFNPILAPCNNKDNLPTASNIFWTDTKEVLDADVIVADISENDLGVAAELGIVFACNFLHSLVEEGKSLEEILNIMRFKDVFCHLSDIRKSTSNMYEGHHIPWGINQYLVGMIESNGVIYDNFEEVLDQLVAFKNV